MTWALRYLPARGIAALVAAHALRFVLFIAAWMLAGRAALAGEPPPVLPTVAALIAAAALAALAVWRETTLTAIAFERLHQRLLDATLRVAPEHARAQGAPAALAHVVEAETLTRDLVRGATTLPVALLELAGAAALIAIAGLSAGPATGGLLAAIAAAACLAVAHTRATRRWTHSRLRIGRWLVDRTAAQRLLALGHHDPGEPHGISLLDQHERDGRAMDTSGVALTHALARALRTTAVVGLALAATTTSTALGLGILAALLAAAGARRLGEALISLASAASAAAALEELIDVSESPPTRDQPRGLSVEIPELRDDHLLLERLAFNLLLARGWPPQPQDIEDAERLCRELGLGALLDSMPAGIHQIVGDTGWQLSAGERSRVAIARALLANPETLTLNDTLDTLDPRSARQALAIARCYATTVIVDH